MSGNQAIAVNSGVFRHADLEITDHGSDWLFTVCAIMGASTVAFMGMAFSKRQTDRLFHYITAAITCTACIAYFAMGSNLGQVPIQAEFVRPNSSQVFAAGTREIFYVRYIDWVVTTPLLLLDLMLTAGMPTSTILATIFADEVMVVTGLVGALTQTTYKWGFWTFGVAAFFFVVYEILIDGRRHANALGGAPKKAYNLGGVWLIGIWFLYPIAWGLCEGGNVIHPDSEAIFYGILDVLAKPGFGFLLLFLHRNIDVADLGLNIREPGQRNISHEKNGRGHHATEGPGPNVGTNTATGANTAV
ncbi:FDD123 protein [Microdochium trichocladiopsis]|uniref:FDD123 protein n=1 Tax=Microdochium trichocladiopsis TaxID=1682393 RepID=A0A9P8XV57_9PEZI|nr:FDD123 protein [Microdochium trichocladiopsis]KAH7018476.1 FDD123 protein [Microdochium trichocladiopsis]